MGIESLMIAFYHHRRRLIPTRFLYFIEPQAANYASVVCICHLPLRIQKERRQVVNLNINILSVLVLNTCSWKWSADVWNASSLLSIID